MSSFRKVNYSLRPAKHAHRRMMAELFSCLYPFSPVREYQYVGFGSLWFEDFKLFHRAHGITKMVSIEKSGAKERFEANRPYQSVKILFGQSNAKLQEVDWSPQSILWLDYDSPISQSMLLDIDTVVSKFTSGSMLAITVNVEEAEEIQEALGQSEDLNVAVELFRSRFSEYSSSKIYSDSLRSTSFRKLCGEIVFSKIEKVLSVRNVGGAEDACVQCQPVCQFAYADGHSMATYVYLLFEERDRNKFEQCDFQALDFLPALGQTIKIQMPVMTLKEIREVESQLPADDLTTITTAGVPDSDIKKFASIYRYLPNFAVLEG